jgi:hypothetical protein
MRHGYKVKMTEMMGISGVHMFLRVLSWWDEKVVSQVSIYPNSAYARRNAMIPIYYSSIQLSNSVTVLGVRQYEGAVICR